jgi:hypothetical protein
MTHQVVTKVDVKIDAAKIIAALAGLVVAIAALLHH